MLSLLRFALLCMPLRLFAVSPSQPPAPAVRVEHFDKDPHWEGRNNRPNPLRTRPVRQDFGYRPADANNAESAIGGFITPSSVAAYYAKPLPKLTLNDTLSASGTLLLPKGRAHLLLGFFNSHSVNEWRTPNSLVIRLQGRGDVFYAYVEYATQKWRAGGDSPGGFATLKDPVTGRAQLKGFPADALYKWSLQYDPMANRGDGSFRVTIGDEEAVCNLSPGHKADGATFDRFGLLNIIKSADDGGEIWLQSVTVNGKTEDLRKAPCWEAAGNHKAYRTTEVRPYGDFGYSPTNFAGGKQGELGGLVFRGDCRDQASMACYGDKLSPLTLDKPLVASGKVSLRRGVSDSTMLIGFYNAKESMTVTPSQKFGCPNAFWGVAIEGPSSEGFYFYPACRVLEGFQVVSNSTDRPHILPDGAVHTWSLTYTPKPEGGGKIVVTLDEKSVNLEVDMRASQAKTIFDRFGIITTWVDGNGQRVYFDDLTYSCSQP